MTTRITAIKTILALTILLFGAYTPAHAQSSELADKYWKQAEEASKSGHDLEAAQLYAKSAEAEKKSPSPRLKDLSSELGRAALFYHRAGMNERALFYYGDALALARKSGDEDKAINFLITVIEIYDSQGKYDKALECSEEALAIARKRGDQAKILIHLSNVGWYCKKLGRLDESLKYYEVALALGRKLEYDDFNANVLVNIISVLDSQMQFEKSNGYREEAVTLARKRGEIEDEIIGLGNIGYARYQQKQYDKALQSYREALEAARKYGKETLVSQILQRIEAVNNTLGKQGNPGKPATVTKDRFHELADQYWSQAKKYKEKGHTLDAANLYLKSAEAEENSPNPRLVDLSASLYQAGGHYLEVSNYNKALKCFEESLVISRKLGQDEKIALRLKGVGAVHAAAGNYRKALEYYDEGLRIVRKLEDKSLIASTLNNIGVVYSNMGQFDKALRFYEEALAIQSVVGLEAQTAIYLGNIAIIYQSWGQYDKALKYHEEALVIDKKLGNQLAIADDLNGIGETYRFKGEHDKALKYYEEALVIARKLGRESEIAESLNLVATEYRSRGEYDKALVFTEEALAIATKLGKEGRVSTFRSNIGSIYHWLGQYEKALKYYKDALTIDKKLGQEDGIASRFSKIGMVHYHLKQYDKAVENLVASINLKEKLRKTATGKARRDYLASQIDTYQSLISSYLHNNDLPSAFSTMEISRAKLLAERLAGSDATPNIPSVRSIQQEMPADAAIISFANSSRDKPVVLVITKDNVTGAELDKMKCMDSLGDTYKRPVEQLLARQRGLKVVSKTVELEKQPQKKGAISFDDVVSYYRSLLTDASSGINRSGRGLVVAGKPGASGSSARLDRHLYDFLIKPLVEQLKGKKRLIIIPDGVLSYLPFESLVDENNNYLVEKYAISYTQSMGILDMLKKRRYPIGRKPMLAFGGAVYDEISYTADMITNEKQLLALAKDVNDTTRSKRALGDAYASLGLAKWDNLPGTLSEVEAITKTVKGTTVVTGRDVTENKVKQLSENGELSNYKAIHFATHGIVVPEIPELSAIVLSQIKNQPAGEDGYLRMDKIEGLKMKADFVNLSACETGLGKIFGGEGVVGLTQSFLLAGANGLSASLWSVNDISTSQFMVALYSMVAQKKAGYGDAINEIKRDFIKGKFGEAYKAPYYWAPFVYYGML